ncbi:hypothetical protein ACI8AG_09950 [Blastococcus sp. SYSU DS0552]
MTRHTRNRVAAATGLTAVASVSAGLLFAPTAFAAPTLPTPTIADATVEVGSPIVLSGTGCLAPEGATHPTDVYFVGPDSSLFDGWTQAEEDGSWTLELAMYVDIEPGTYQLEVNCDYYTADGQYPPVTVTVVPPGSKTPAPEKEAPAPEKNSAPTPTGAIRGESANTAGVGPATSTAAKSAAPGQKIVKVIKGFKPGEKVTLTMHSTPTTIGTFTADGDGVVTAEFTLAEGTAEGTHTLVYEGDQGTYFQETLEVAAATTSTDSLAYTGASVGLPLALGAGLLVAGGGALVVSRRRAGASQA